MAGPRLVLASRSPQRRAILEQLGIAFTVQEPRAEELEEGDPRALVLENALRKARSAAGELVLGVDTTVALDGRAHGKPATEAEARTTLETLAGRTHEVHTAIALIEGETESTATATTAVTFRELERRDIDWYLLTGEWRDRAGAYAIQGKGAALIERIEGDYTTVVGLPTATLLSLRPDLLTT